LAKIAKKPTLARTFPATRPPIVQAATSSTLESNSSYLYPSLGFVEQVGIGYYNLKGIPNASFKQQINEQFNTVLGFNLNIPIFNKFETKNSVKKAQIDVESNKLNVDNVKLELRKTVQQAYYNAVAAKGKWDAAQKSETASIEAYRFTNQKYEGGRATVYELYQAKNNLTQAQSQVVQSKYEYVFRLKILELLK